MPDIHTIRLRHPWKCEPIEGGARWSRSFNWPAGLTPRERVALVVDGLPESARVALNGNALSEHADVTPWIAVHNLVTIELPGDSPSDLDSFPFDVRLEIDEG